MNKFFSVLLQQSFINNNYPIQPPDQTHFIASVADYVLTSSDGRTLAYEGVLNSNFIYLATYHRVDLFLRDTQYGVLDIQSGDWEISINTRLHGNGCVFGIDYDGGNHNGMRLDYTNGTLTLRTYGGYGGGSVTGCTASVGTRVGVFVAYAICRVAGVYSIKCDGAVVSTASPSWQPTIFEHVFVGDQIGQGANFAGAAQDWHSIEVSITA